MMITHALRAALEAVLSDVRAVTPAGGGDINEAARVETQDARYFVKWNSQARPRMFEAEARGLNLLASAKALRIPRVVAVIEQPAALVLEWIDLGSNKAAAPKRWAAVWLNSTDRQRRRTASITTTSSARLLSTILPHDHGSSSIAISGWAHKASGAAQRHLHSIGHGGSIR